MISTAYFYPDSIRLENKTLTQPKKNGQKERTNQFNNYKVKRSLVKSINISKTTS